jgi:hypothetical protein
MLGASLFQSGNLIESLILDMYSFYPTSGPDADKNGNTKPGTVVE